MRRRRELRAGIETSRERSETQKATTIIYVTDGEGMFAAGARTQRLTKGDVIVVPAGTAQSFTSVAPSISYLLITVPVLATDAKAEVVYADHDKVAATMKKAGPLADGPNLRVSGGFRTGPYAPADYRPTWRFTRTKRTCSMSSRDARRRCSAATSSAARQTAPGQIRGSTDRRRADLPARQRRRHVGARRHAALVSGNPRAAQLSAGESVLLTLAPANSRSMYGSRTATPDIPCVPTGGRSAAPRTRAERSSAWDICRRARTVACLRASRPCAIVHSKAMSEPMLTAICEPGFGKAGT